MSKVSELVDVIVGQFRTLVEGELRSVRQGIPAGGLGRLEERLVALRRSVDAMLLDGLAEAVGNGYQGPSVPCRCGGSMRYVSDRSKTFLTVLGDLTLKRAYYRCSRCGASRVPLDEALGLVGEGQSIGVRVMTALVCSLLPHGQAMGLLGELAIPHPSVSEAQRITRAVGGQATAWRDEEAAQWVEERQAPVEHVERRSPRRLALSMDGTTAHTDGAWHEAKVGAFFAFDEEGKPLSRRAYLATFGGIEAFRALWDTEAQRWHLAAVDVLIALCDGAPWTWNTIAEYCPAHVVEILDFYHASEHLWKLARAVWGEGSERAKAWVGEQKERLLEDQLAAFFAALEQWDIPGPWQEEAQAQLRYFTANRERLHYKEYRARGYPIGSGLVEAACKTVICQREKQPGMRWRKDTAEAIAHLRTVRQSGRWDALRRRLIDASVRVA